MEHEANRTENMLNVHHLCCRMPGRVAIGALDASDANFEGSFLAQKCLYLSISSPI